MSLKNKKTGSIKPENKKQEAILSDIKIPSVKEFTKDEIIEIYKEEIKKKDKIISDLQTENKLLLDVTMKNAKRRIEELENKISESEKKETTKNNTN